MLLVVAGLLFRCRIPQGDVIVLRRRFAVRTLCESRGFFTAFSFELPVEYPAIAIGIFLVPLRYRSVCSRFRVTRCVAGVALVLSSDGLRSTPVGQDAPVTT